MKFIANQMPKSKKECPFSKYEQPKNGIKYSSDYYKCKLDKKVCNLDEDHPITCMQCRWLKVE